MLRFILASQSPRRRFFLEKRGYLFHTFPVEISEFLDKNLRVEDAVEVLAEEKAQALVESGRLAGMEPCLILSADTIVHFKEQILGKPKDQDQAFETLKTLSGQTHRVITAFCLWHLPSQKKVRGHAVSEVEFRDLQDEEVWDYVRSGDPMDKAGSYGIQSLARNFIRDNHISLDQAQGKDLGSTFRTNGLDFVKNFTGSLENIAGLPVEEIEKVIKREGWTLPVKGSHGTNTQ